MRKARRQWQRGHCLAVWRWPRIASECTEARQARAGLSNCSFWRRINPFEVARIAHPPQRAIKRECREISLQYLRRIKARHPGGRRFLPQTVGHTGRLSRSAAAALRYGGLARAFGNEAGHSSRTVITRTARQSRIDHDPHPVKRQAGFGN